jgi:hypothetical protein
LSLLLQGRLICFACTAAGDWSKMTHQAPRARAAAAAPAAARPLLHVHSPPPPARCAGAAAVGVRSPLQEYLNAATMVLPNFVSVWFLLHHMDPETGRPAPVPPAALSIMLATAMHMVFSVAFHVNNALQLQAGAWDERLQLWIMPCGRRWHPTAHNSYRRLDQVRGAGLCAYVCVCVCACVCVRECA